MKLIVDISEEIYNDFIDYWVKDADILHAVRYNGTPLKEWLQTFNTDSATECFTAIQRLKESLDEDSN
ncbi:MAG: hypothetical protein J6T10_29445 [Methanobrevibacter sp.]|nr:hypothetical protein [Methanobrevibacter sp.]